VKLSNEFTDRAAATAPAPASDMVPTGTAGVLLPPGPAGDAAEAVARARAQAASAAATRSPASPPAADDVAGPAREDALDLGEGARPAGFKQALPAPAVAGEVARPAVLKRALPALAVAAVVAGVVVWRARR
jgi:hypothetical protein